MRTFLINIIRLVSVFILLSTPFISLADTNTTSSTCSGGSCKYQLLAPISAFEGVGADGTIDIKNNGVCGYLVNLYKFGVYIAIGLAVMMIVIGGMQYVSTDAVSGKDDGKKRITSALQGLILALMAYLILQVVNPKLVGCNLNLATTVNLSGDLGQSAGTFGQSGGSSGSTSGGSGTSSGGSNSGPTIDPTTGRITNNGLTSWGDSSASQMQGQVIDGRQTYYASGETNSDSCTDAGYSACGMLVEGNANTVGSAASVYYPKGTLVEVNGVKYVIDDNNLVKQSNGSYKPANNVLTNNYTVDLYTKDVNKANSQTTNYSMKVLFVPNGTVSSSQVSDIRNNPNKYITQ